MAASTLAEGWDVYWQPDAHEEAREGLRKVFAVRREQTHTRAALSGDPAREGERNGKGLAEIHYTYFALQVRKRTGGEQVVGGKVTTPRILKALVRGQMT